MTPQHILSPEFRNEFEQTRYPFADNASLVSSDGTQTLAINTFQDAAVYPIGGRARMYISQIEVASRAVIITISDETNTPRCTAQFDPLDAPYLLQLQDDYGRPAGVLVSTPERLAIFNAWDTGVYNFELGTTEFVATVTIPTPGLGLRGILTEAGELLTDDIWIVGDRGVVVREDDGAIRVDVIGDPLFVRKLCEQLELFTPPVFLKTINGCPPNEFGEFQIIVGDHGADDPVLRITPTGENTIQISAVGKINR